MDATTVWRHISKDCRSLFDQTEFMTESITMTSCCPECGQQLEDEITLCAVCSPAHTTLLEEAHRAGRIKLARRKASEKNEVRSTRGEAAATVSVSIPANIRSMKALARSIALYLGTTRPETISCIHASLVGLDTKQVRLEEFKNRFGSCLEDAGLAPDGDDLRVVYHAVSAFRERVSTRCRQDYLAQFDLDEASKLPIRADGRKEHRATITAGPKIVYETQEPAPPPVGELALQQFVANHLPGVTWKMFREFLDQPRFIDSMAGLDDEIAVLGDMQGIPQIGGETPRCLSVLPSADDAFMRLNEALA